MTETFSNRAVDWNFLPNSGSDLQPLHTAARLGNVEYMQELIAQGHCVNTGDWDFVRPLHEACFRGYYACVKLLLENGAEANARNIDGATPICDAASSGQVECVKLLLTYGAQINPPLLLSSPLHEAVMRDQWQCCELLLESGAKLEHSDCHFGTPLHVAACQGHRKSAEVLLKAGSNINALMMHKTPLHEVARKMDCEFIILLLEFGANVHAYNNQGLRPIDLVPSATSPAKELLYTWEKNVRGLKSLCRWKIRQCLGTSRLQEMDKLYLPKLMVDYLQYS